VHCAERVGGGQADGAGGDNQLIRFVFAQLFDGLAGAFDLDLEAGCGGAGSMLKGMPVSRKRMFRKRIRARSRRGSVKPLKPMVQLPVDQELALPRRRAGRQGHDGQRSGGLGLRQCEAAAKDGEGE